MAVLKRGGQKKPFPTRKEYRRHLRDQVKQGKGHNASGDPIPGSEDSGWIRP